MNRTVIIADTQNEYMQRLGQYLERFYEDQINLISCIGKEELKAAIHPAEKPLVLIADELASSVQRLLWEIPVVVLTEERDACSIPGARSIWKYQRIDTLYNEITAAYEQKEKLVLFHRPKPWRILLFQGVSGGVGTSTMAAVCARNLAQMGKKVLYLNLEPLGTADFYFQSREGKNLSDFLQEVEAGADAVELMESGSKKDSSGVTYLSTSRNAADYYSINWMMLQKAIGRLSVSGLFDYCILDKPFSLEKSHAVWLEVSNRVIFVTDGSETGNLKFVRAFLSLANDRIKSRSMLLYNKVQPGCFKELAHVDLPVLGKVEYLSAPDRKSIEKQIAERGIFMNLDGKQ